MVAWPGTGKNRKPNKPGLFYNADVYQGHAGRTPRVCRLSRAARCRAAEQVDIGPTAPTHQTKPADPATDHTSTIWRTMRPMQYLSYRSRLIAWVDANCPYAGEEELRAMDDPDFSGIKQLPIRPRVKTAPAIQRP